MTTIIMKTSSQFKPHYNRELGKKYYSSRDYYGDMKAKGLEPYKEGSVRKPTRKEYKGVSEEAKRMMNSVTYDRHGKPNIGDRYIQKLHDMGVRQAPKGIDPSRGGWHG